MHAQNMIITQELN